MSVSQGSTNKWVKVEFNEIATLSKQKFNPQKEANDRLCVELEHIEKETGRLIGTINSAGQLSTKNAFRTGDVLFGKLRPNLRKYIHCDFDGVCSSEIWVLNAQEKTNSHFLFYLIQQEKFIRSACITSGSKMPRADWAVVSEVPFPLPPLPEQKAIAALLSTWDEAIEKTERLIQAKERQKIGELHSRISGQKANSTIGSFAKPVVRKVDKPDESYVAVGIRSHFKGTFQRLVEDPRTVNMDSLYRVKENDLIVNITFAWEGAIALVNKEDEECYVSHRFPTYEIKRSKAEPCFIRQLIMSSRMKYDLSNISPGGAGRNRVLNKKDFLKMPIWLPDLETQKNIGEYLGAIDNEIDLLKQLVDKYKTQKRGLMQKMLTGECRVKPEIVNQYMEA